MNDLFEKAFENFLERKEYDEAQEALFHVVRAAFLAGWKAAGGEMPKPQPVVSLLEQK